MTPLAWILLGLVIMASIVFPVAVLAIARHMGKRPSDERGKAANTCTAPGDTPP